MSLLVSLLVGMALSALIGWVAHTRGALTRGGIFGAVLTGTPIFGFGGFLPSLLLVAFFVSASVLSRYKAHVKDQFADRFQKGSRRDLGQALANGGWAALLAIGYGTALEAFPRALWFAALLGALATVTADTWATELGVLSSRAPRLITTGRIVPSGTSGGITWLGTLAALAGSLFIGLTALGGATVLTMLAPGIGLGFERELVAHGAIAVLLATGSGLAGSAFDSWLGATVQAIYFCEYCETQTEQHLHRCGNATRRVRGWRCLDNDRVNFLASVFGSIVAASLAWLMWPR